MFFQLALALSEILRQSQGQVLGQGVQNILRKLQGNRFVHLGELPVDLCRAAKVKFFASDDEKISKRLSSLDRHKGLSAICEILQEVDHGNEKSARHV
jgi:hypothetical protein